MSAPTGIEDAHPTLDTTTAGESPTRGPLQECSSARPTPSSRGTAETPPIKENRTKITVLAGALALLLGIQPAVVQSPETRTWLGGATGWAAPVEGDDDPEGALSLNLSQQRGAHVASLRGVLAFELFCDDFYYYSVSLSVAVEGGSGAGRVGVGVCTLPPTLPGGYTSSSEGYDCGSMLLLKISRWIFQRPPSRFQITMYLPRSITCPPSPLSL